MFDKDRVKKYNINIYANMHGGGKICRHVNTPAGFGGQSRGSMGLHRFAAYARIKCR